jgi:hypothetical protein
MFINIYTMKVFKSRGNVAFGHNDKQPDYHLHLLGKRDFHTFEIYEE